MIQKNSKRYISLVLLLTCWIPMGISIVPFNLFEPYDVLIKPQRPAWRGFDFLIGYEGAVHTSAFMDDCDLKCESAHGNVLQLWQKKQDAIAAFKGFSPESAIGQQSQFFNFDDDNLTHGHFTPSGKLQSQNLLFAAQFRIPHNITLAAYIPYRVASLTDVRWCEDVNDVLFEDLISPNLITTIEQLGCLNLRGWKRHGPGDLMLQAEYYFHRPQAKPYLRNVGIELRGGLLIPTGLKEDINKLLAFSFGNDGGAGILAAVRLELWFIHYLRFAIDVELLHLFGNKHYRRVKTNPAQTDLLLLATAPVFKEPGLRQHYTLWADVIGFHGFTARVAYQYTRNNEDKYFICAEGFNPSVVNNAESLQDWTAHQLVFSTGYTWYCEKFNPSLSVFGKYAFNGKRAILADTVGLTFGIAF